MQQSVLEELYDQADYLVMAKTPEDEAIKIALKTEGVRPDVWFVEWAARIDPTDWQLLLESAVRQELASRAYARRYSPEDAPFADERDEAEDEAAVLELVDAASSRWESIQYKDIDGVMRELKDLSRDWWHQGEHQVQRASRNLAVGNFRLAVYGILKEHDVWTPADLPEEAFAEFSAAAGEVFPDKVRSHH
jgi:hypothetical protein